MKKLGMMNMDTRMIVRSARGGRGIHEDIMLRIETEMRLDAIEPEIRQVETRIREIDRELITLL